jgi:3-oxoacyl-[acyl-carrier protein] reductase
MREGVVITGGTNGLGRALSLGFAHAGYAVVALYSADRTAADALTAELSAGRLEGRCLLHDIGAGAPALRESDDWDAVTIVNNAWPAFEPRPFHLTGWPEVERAIRVGVGGAYDLIHSLLPKMVRARKGTIVNVLTTAIRDPVSKGFGGYVVAKQALRGLTMAVAAEYSDRGVRSFSVSPRYMLTPRTSAWNERLRELFAGERVEVDDVARAIVARARDSTSGTRGEDYLVP